MEYWKANMYPATDLDDLREYLKTTKDSSAIIKKKLKTIKLETEHNITLCKNSQSEDAKEIRELGAELLTYIDCEICKLTPVSIEQNKTKIAYHPKDLFDKDFIDFLKCNGHYLINDIEEYIQQDRTGAEIYTLIIFLHTYKTKYWKNSVKRTVNCNTIIQDKPRVATKWRDRFCNAFQIDTNILKHYKPKSPIVKKTIDTVKKHFHYL